MFNGCPLDCKILSYNVCELVLNLDINVQQESLHRQFFMNLKQSDWKDFRLYSKIKFNSFFLSNDLLDFFQRTSFSSLFSFLYILTADFHLCRLVQHENNLVLQALLIRVKIMLQSLRK